MRARTALSEALIVALAGAISPSVAVGQSPDHLTKPVKAEDLRETLERWIPAPVPAGAGLERP